jgi:hypothetical protein
MEEQHRFVANDIAILEREEQRLEHEVAESRDALMEKSAALFISRKVLFTIVGRK